MKLGKLFPIFLLFWNCESFNFGRKMFEKHHGMVKREPVKKIRRHSPEIEAKFDSIGWQLVKLQEAFELAKHHAPNLEHHYITHTCEKYMFKFE